ncbi:MAG: hypothetical protein H7175_09935, partial [Burkholderiales bacterium]|nr:hypothetical protein [Anaerolineae bacterium]
FLAWAALISILGNLLLDFVSLWVSMTAIGGEVSAGRWDLLRLTSLREDGIVEAKHALAQLRAWRITLVVVGLRLGLVIILALHGFVLLPLFGNGGDIFGYSDFGTGVVLYTTLAIFFAVYIFEPLWRMRTQTALGMMVSTYTRSVVYAALGSLGMMIAVLVVQALIIAAIGFVISVLTRGFGYTSQLSSMCFILVVCSATAVIIYMFYRTVGEWALGRTTRRAFIAD